MITAANLTKRYGVKIAVDDVSFSAHPGSITGFLGPNGAGKSTTLRMIMGLVSPTAGQILVNGKPLAAHTRPQHEVGALLDASAAHPRRRARDHLLALAATAGISSARVYDVLDMVGLTEVATKRVDGFSLGMAQRLGLASALLADPQTLVLDEPINGLDPEGVRWVRDLLKQFARRGRTVLLSSHLMSEMELTADRVIVIGQGRLLRDQTMAEFIDQASPDRVAVRTPQAQQLSELLVRHNAVVIRVTDDRLTVTGVTAGQISAVAAHAGINVLELTPQSASLEDAYMALTADSLVYGSRNTYSDSRSNRSAE